MKSEESKIALSDVSEIVKVQTVMLLCIEKEDGSFCHRHILKKLIAEKLESE